MTDENNRPGLDEQTFGKLIEAAYVLQEHNREMRQMEESLELHTEQLRQQDSAAAQNEFLGKDKIKDQEAQANNLSGDYTLTLAEIVEAQHQIQRRHLELDPAMALVVERVARITNASGAAIGLLDGKTVRYRAGAGPTALPTGTNVTLDAAVCAASVRTGQVIRSEDVSLEFLFDAEGCLKRGIQSLISVPIYHDGNIAGALELYFDRIRGFIEQDVHTCQLMAGLVTEAIGRDTETSLKRSVASERSTMLEAIEKLKPDLIALVDQNTTTAVKHSGSTSHNLVCRNCGSPVLSIEQFCGTCGESRVSGREPSETQRKIAEAWRSERASQENNSAGSRNGSSSLASKHFAVPSLLDDLEREEALYQTREPLSSPWDESVAGADHGETQHPYAIDGEAIIRRAIPAASLPQEDAPHPGPAIEDAAAALNKPKSDVTWTSAAKAREFLETLSSGRPGGLAQLWRERRGMFYLILAVILVIVAIRWGIMSENDAGAAARKAAVPGATNNHKRAIPNPEPELSAFDKFLISVGLADPPPAPEYKGNPYVQVWVDSHTALYYCPGSELYGKTPQGRYATQRDAEMDQFEPAERKACD